MKKSKTGQGNFTKSRVNLGKSPNLDADGGNILELVGVQAWVRDRGGLNGG